MSDYELTLWSPLKGKALSFFGVKAKQKKASDEALLEECAKGNVQALEPLFDRYHGVVYSFLIRIMASYRSDLEDLVQITFLEVYKSSGKFRRNSRVRTWILGIAANLAKHHIRDTNRRKVLNHAVIEHLQTPSERPDEKAERQELVAQLTKIVKALPHDLRVAFVMCDVEGVRCVDAAKALGIPEGTMGRRLYEARRMLRASLGGTSSC